METVVKATLTIRRNSDGLTRTSETTWRPDDEDESDRFYWTDGNGSCDCNRAILFGDPPGECTSSAYSIPFVTLEDGRVLPVDDAD
jgi:hypothetical protein